MTIFQIHPAIELMNHSDINLDQLSGAQRLAASINRMPMEWDLESGRFWCVNIPAAMFWLDPSLRRMLEPLRDEVGGDLYDLLVAHYSSMGTDQDYHSMVTELAGTFEEGFLAWGRAVSAAGWGRVDLPECDCGRCHAKVIVHNPWELEMLGEAGASWSCPFLQGKIIGIFSYAFGTTCWADMKVVDRRKGASRVEFLVHPSDRTIQKELGKLREMRRQERELELAAEVQRKTEELRQIELQMQRVEKLKCLGLLAGGIAHDFNNILTSILGNASLAQDGVPADTDPYTCLRQIEIAARRAADLCHKMLAYAGGAGMVRHPTDLSVVVKDIAVILQASISKKIQVELDLAPDLPMVEADPAQLQQVVMNLLLNASEAIGEQSGTIWIRTTSRECGRGDLSDSYIDENLEPGHYVVLEIRDSGCGMSQETRARLFDPFYTTKFKGRGLGLAAVLGIVRSHKGAIQIHSEQGHGAEFRVMLPATRHPAGTEHELALPPRRRRPGSCILVIDDEAAVRNLAIRALQSQGYGVESAGGGREGIACFGMHANRLDLVLLDMTMPDMSGIEVLQRLRVIRPDIPVILSSGYAEEHITQRTRQDPRLHFLQKPYQIGELFRVVDQSLVPPRAPSSSAAVPSTEVTA